jgi:hypothetical protein
MPQEGSLRTLWIGTISAVAAILLIANGAREGVRASAGAFFGGGALFLVAGIGFAAWGLGRLAVGKTRLSFATLILRGCARRRSRSVATMAILASGAFLIAAVQTGRIESDSQTTSRASGTGGFALIGESAFPILRDLDSAAGRDFYGLEELGSARTVAFRLRDGDEASCLNLNRAQTPRLLGVDPKAMRDRNAFVFSQTVSKTEQPWMLLQPTDSGVVPVIADEASMTWALGKKIGDTMDLTDESGGRFTIRFVGALANSILQGSIVMDEAEFSRHFPGINGHRFFLFDAPAESGTNGFARASSLLSRALADAGMELTPAAVRLATLNAVQNTYLDTFLILGGLGLILGSAGLGAVALRNAFERRAELALLLALGFEPAQIRRMFFWEHGVLLTAGLGLGTVCALAAMAPLLASPTAHIPWLLLSATLGLVFATGLLCSMAAVRAALRGKLLPALRGE